MTNEQAQKVLDELQGVRPEILNNEAKRLFEAIMKIADERDELKNEAKEKDKIIDLMAKYISNIRDCPFENEGKYLDCEKMCDIRTDMECWKQYFENKAKEVE